MKTYIIILIWIAAIATAIALGMLNDYVKMKLILSVLGG